jgi:hypothetical protein
MVFLSRIVIEDCSGQQGNEHLTYSCSFDIQARTSPAPGKSSALMKPEEEDVLDVFDI